MKTYYLFIFLFVFKVGLLVGQSDTATTHLKLSKEEKTRHFGIGLGLIYNTKPQLIYSPNIQLFPTKDFSLYCGPSFIIPLDTVQLKNKKGFRVGTKIYFLNKKIKPSIKLEFSRLKYEFNSIIYDYAVPNIPIKATVLNKHKSECLIINPGVTYVIKNRFFISLDAGLNILFERKIDPGTYESYKYKNDGERIPLRIDVHYTFLIETGIYF